MMIFRLSFLILSLWSSVTYSYIPEVPEGLIRNHQKELKSEGYFLEKTNEFYYVGISMNDNNSHKKELEILMVFQERLAGFFEEICNELSLSFPQNYKINIPFTKQIIRNKYGTFFLAVMSQEIVHDGAKLYCQPSK